jgi:hypothetical protein
LVEIHRAHDLRLAGKRLAKLLRALLALFGMVLPAVDLLGDASVGIAADHVIAGGAASGQEGEQEEGPNEFHELHSTDPSHIWERGLAQRASIADSRVSEDISRA